MRNRIAYSSILAVMIGVAVLITLVYQLPTWILFIAWVSYSVFGKKMKDIFLSLSQLVFGSILAALILLIGGSLQNFIGIASIPIAITIVVFIFLFLDQYLKPFTNINAYFLGMIALFSMHPPLSWGVFWSTAFTILLGFLFGWGTDMIDRLFDVESK